MRNIKAMFDSKDQELQEVIILPWLTRNAATGTITLPVGYEWKDFEYIEWGMGINVANVNYDQCTIIKEEIEASPTGWINRGNYSDSNVYSCAITGISATEATWQSSGSDVNYPLIMKGYLKRYATTNNSATVQLTPDNTTGGTFTADGKVGISQRYGLDIASVLGADWVDKNLEVKVELYASGTNYTGWGTTNAITYLEGVWASFGLEAVVRDDGIIEILTGHNGLIVDDSADHNVWGAGNTNEALCRIRVNKGDQVATRLVGNGGAGKTVLYDGAVVGTGGTLTTNDAITNYDMVLFYASWNDQISYTMPLTLEPDEVMRANATHYRPIVAGEGTDLWTSIESAISPTQFRVGSLGGGGIYKVVGINYA